MLKLTLVLRNCSRRWGENVSEPRPPTGLLFISMERHGGMIVTAENRRNCTKPVPVTLCPPQIRYGLPLDARPRLRCEKQATNDLPRHETAKKYEIDGNKFNIGIATFLLLLPLRTIIVCSGSAVSYSNYNSTKYEHERWTKEKKLAVDHETSSDRYYRYQNKDVSVGSETSHCSVYFRTNFMSNNAARRALGATEFRGPVTKNLH